MLLAAKSTWAFVATGKFIDPAGMEEILFISNQSVTDVALG